MEQNKLKSYASTFASYLIRNLGNDVDKIDRIILYGSVVKGEASKESDVDIFIDTKNKKIGIKLKMIIKEFYESREAAFFKIKGISNEISLKVGELRQWKELSRSIAGHGLILWGKFEAKEKPIGTKHQVILSWEKISQNRGAFLNKLYGYRVKDKRYLGFLEKTGGIKLGKSCILIPFQSREEIIPLLKKYGVKAWQKEVFVFD